MRKKQFVLVLIFSVFVAAIIRAFFGDSPLFSTQIIDPKIFGQKFKENNSIADKNDVVLVVDSTPVIREQFENTRAFLTVLKNKPVTDSEVRDKLIDDLVVYNEAIRRGSEVSLEEAKAFSLKTKAAIRDPNTENAELIKSVIASEGFSTDEFFDKVAPERYQKALTMGKLREQVSSMVDQDLDPKLSPDEKMEKEIEAFNQFVKELKAKAVIE